MKQRLTQWVMLAGCALAIFCGGRPEQAHAQQGGSVPGISAAQLTGLTNRIIQASNAITLSPWVGDSWPTSLEAAQCAQSYRQQLLLAGGPDIRTNGVQRRMVAGLATLFAAVGKTSVVDVMWYWPGWHVGSGSNLFTMSGRIPDKMAPAGLSWTEQGVHTTNAFWRYIIPDSTYRTLVVSYSGNTNHTGSSYRWLISNLHTTSTHSAACRLSIGTDQPAAQLYPYTANGAARQGGAIFSRKYSGLSAGADSYNPWARTLLVTTDGTNSESWVNGLQANASGVGVTTNASSACNALVLGAMDWTPNNPWVGAIGCAVVLNRYVGGQSNVMLQIDQAMQYFEGAQQMVFYGDSITEAVDAGVAGTGPGWNWPASMIIAAGRTNGLRVDVHAYSGRTAATLATEAPQTGWPRGPWSAAYPGVGWVFCGVNDVLLSGSSADTTFGAISNLARTLRTIGFSTVVLVPSPIGTNASSYSGTKSNTLGTLRGLILGATNQPGSPITYAFDTWWMFPTNTVNNTNYLVDGLHWSKSNKVIFGQAMWASNLVWRPTGY